MLQQSSTQRSDHQVRTKRASHEARARVRSDRGQFPDARRHCGCTNAGANESRHVTAITPANEAPSRLESTGCTAMDTSEHYNSSQPVVDSWRRDWLEVPKSSTCG